jgi:hypothetical protein
MVRIARSRSLEVFLSRLSARCRAQSIAHWRTPKINPVVTRTLQKKNDGQAQLYGGRLQWNGNARLISAE